MYFKRIISLFLFNKPETYKVFQKIDSLVGEWDRNFSSILANEFDNTYERCILKISIIPLLISIIFIVFFSLFSYLSVSLLENLIFSFNQNIDVKKLLCDIAFFILVTITSWIFLNITFLMSDIYGLKIKYFTEIYIFYSQPKLAITNNRSSLSNLIDKEASRMQVASESIVISVLIFSTIIYVTVFLSLLLGYFSLVIYATILFSSSAIFYLSKKLEKNYIKISNLTKNRVNIGIFGFQHKLSTYLNGWNSSLIKEYKSARDSEVLMQKKTYWLLLCINGLSSMTPVLAILALAVVQYVLLRTVNVIDLVSSVAVIGGLRSAANGVPGLVQGLAMGKAAIKEISRLGFLSKMGQYQCQSVSTIKTSHYLIDVENEDIQKFERDTIENLGWNLLISPTDPWIFSGSVLDNLKLYSSEPNIDQIREALNAVKLDPDSVLYDDNGQPRLISNTHGFSRGQKKRLELARLILSDAPVILLINPTEGLDDEMADGFLEFLLKNHLNEKTVFYISNRKSEDKICNIISYHQFYNFFNRSAAEVKIISGGKVEYPILQHNDGKPLNQRIHEKISLLNVGGLIAIGLLLFLFRELSNIAMDYNLINSNWSQDVSNTFLITSILLLLYLYFTTLGYFIIVTRLLRKSTALCISLFQKHLYSLFDNLLNIEPSHITRDQRIFDEKFPLSLIELISTFSVLLAAIIYVGTQSVFVALVTLPLFFLLVQQNFSHGNTILDFVSLEIKKSALYQQALIDIERGGYRELDYSTRRKVKWLASIQAKQLFASFYRILCQRWFSIRIDCIGLLFFLTVLIGSIVLYSEHGFSIGMTLALSFSYSLISLFGRLSRNYNEVKESLESSYLIAVRNKSIKYKECNNIEATINSLTFQDVSFSYGIRSIFSNLNLNLRTGESLCITGSSGSGKSTIVSLISGFAIPHTGKICIFGQDSKNYDFSNGSVAYINHTPLLRPGPIYNLFTQEDIHQGNFDHIIEHLPNRWDYIVPLNGSIELSNASIQEIALSTAHIKKSRLIILDEALTCFDEAKAIKLFLKLKHNCPDAIIICITHDKRFIRLTDHHFHIT